MINNHITGGQELLCINTEKVYDWLLNEASFDLNIDGLELPINTVTGAQLECDDIDLNNVTCTVTPSEEDPFVILDREDQVFIIDGEEVTLQVVNIRKSFDVIVYVQLIPELGGRTIEIGTATFSRCEQVILCAPEGTDINVSYTDLDCFVCSVNCDTGTTTEIDELNVTFTVRLCQSIQSTYEVTIELEADFCQPRDVLPVPPCPTPTIPVQCPVVFPALDPEPEISKKKKHVSSETKTLGMMYTEQQPKAETNIEITNQEPESNEITKTADLTNVEEKSEGEE
ncbi:hypothetical protein SAMN04487943_10793 [Gracilibacillus orientalis]|uniref:Uncharacterized protein n=1 Tax=Gracilibacillus orientalis TaxID=334253 RepID=A0A1I4MUH5_9BACI|nr:hypothetical protein [Gracilibacillus orientalis]SFM06737.1 hypothetical protein SAMN04487943_10793 [Gracilibacillus orientalis]